MKGIGTKLTCAVTAFALMISFVAYLSLDDSLAWFSRNREVQAQGMSVAVKTFDMQSQVVSYGVTKIVTDENNISTYIYGKELSELPEDGYGNITHSEYLKALVIKLTVKNNSTDAKNIKIELKANTASPSTENDNYISNCITINNTATLVADSTVQVTNSENAVQQFVTIDKTSATATKTTNLVLVKSAEVLAGATTDFYFVIEYNYDFLKYISDHILKEHANTPDKFAIKYSNDVQFVITLAS